MKPLSFRNASMFGRHKVCHARVSGGVVALATIGHSMGANPTPGGITCLSALLGVTVTVVLWGCGDGLLSRPDADGANGSDSYAADVLSLDRAVPADAGGVDLATDAAGEGSGDETEPDAESDGSAHDQGHDLPVNATADSAVRPDSCQLICGPKECGSNGCGGSCGTCDSHEDCTIAGWCEAPATPTAAPPVRILSANACGASCPYSGVSASTWAVSLADEISYWSADAIVFQELCYGQLSALRGHLGSGWGYVWWTQWTQNSGCSRWGSDLRSGMAIMAKHAGGGPLPNRLTATLPKTADCTDVNKRGLLCAKPLIDGKSVLTCVTHFSHKATCGVSRDLQAKQVADLALRWSNGGASIVAGDLNAHPDDPVLNSLYQVDGSGRYLEADQEQAKWWPASCTGACRSGEPTYPTVNPRAKIDYILFSAAHFGSVTGDAVDSDGSMSDHRLLRGAAVRK